MLKQNTGKVATRALPAFGFALLPALPGAARLCLVLALAFELPSSGVGWRYLALPSADTSWDH